MDAGATLTELTAPLGHASPAAAMIYLAMGGEPDRIATPPRRPAPWRVDGRPTAQWVVTDEAVTAP